MEPDDGVPGESARLMTLGEDEIGIRRRDAGGELTDGGKEPACDERVAEQGSGDQLGMHLVDSGDGGGVVKQVEELAAREEAGEGCDHGELKGKPFASASGLITVHEQHT